MLRRALAIAAIVMSFDTAAASLAGPIELYDAASGVAPNVSPWLWSYGQDLAGSTVQMMTAPPAVVLDTRSSGGKAGYSKLSATPLDSDVGFVLDFRLRVVDESHANANRSGFSVLVLDQAKLGVEVSFWTNQVFAKNADRTANGTFTHGESIAVDTRSVARDYSLTFHAGQYSLVTAGVAPLVGALRHYATAADFPFNIVPYGTANYLFIGDNTSSASALVEFGSMTLAPIPEPGVWVLLLAGLACVARQVHSRRSHANPRG